MYQKKYSIHFTGIGGIGMSGIAELLINLGYKVSGSDIKSSYITKRLEKLGAKIFYGHCDKNIQNSDVVVLSSAIPKDNPEVVAAAKRSIPTIPRAEMLAELMRLKYSIAVSGSHGKTTTTSIISWILEKGGLDPTIVIGGRIKRIKSNAFLGKGKYIVAEADESDGSFLKMSPTMAVITNIDLEHLDYYKDMATIKNFFLDFLDKIPFYGLNVLCLDNEPIQEIIPYIKKRFVTYGISSQADLQAKNIKFDGPSSKFSLKYKDKDIDFILKLPGMHNVYNALAGISIGLELGIEIEVIKDALESLEGVERRIEIKGEIDDILVIDDYGHHPTEIKATLNAISESWPDMRKVVIFQPHRYTRTKALFDEFVTSFYKTDMLIILPVYSAGEKNIKGAESINLADEIAKHGHKNVVYAKSFEIAYSILEKTLRAKDLLLTLGAGDVYKIGENIVKKASVKNV